jgi:hypothetical protein
MPAQPHAGSRLSVSTRKGPTRIFVSLRYCLTAIALFLASCEVEQEARIPERSQIQAEATFEPGRWNATVNGITIYRKSMIDDMMKNHS